VSIFVERIRAMSKVKPYKETKEESQMVNEPMVAYIGNKVVADIVMGERADIGIAISGEELLDRLRPRIKALFK
ncbi:hypothetical protein, partial [Bacteroides rodentium]